MSKKELTGEEGVDYVVCQICGKWFKNLSSHLIRSHNITKDKYLKLYPNSLLISSKLKLSMSHNTLKMWDNDDYRGSMVSHWQNYWKDEENRSDQSIRTSEYSKLHPEKGKEHSDSMKEMWSDDDKRKKQSEILTKIWDDQAKRDKSSKDNIKRLSKLTKEEIMELTLGMRSYWTSDKKDEHNQWQRNRWTPEMRDGWSKDIIQRYINHPELRDNASIKTIEQWNNLTENEKIEHGMRISAGQQGILYEDWTEYADSSRVHLLSINKCYHINKSFIGCHAHHITRSIIINVPAELHNHIKHNFKTGFGMCEMNILALQFINGYYND